jgi:hypothetical protein
MATRFLLTYLAQVRRFSGIVLLKFFPYSHRLNLIAIIMRHFSPTKSKIGATVLRKVAAITGIVPGVER